MSKLIKPVSPISVERPKTLSKPSRPTEVSSKEPVVEAVAKGRVKDKAIGKSYSLRESQHQWVTDEAIRQSAELGKRVTASNLLSEILAKHIESQK
ncbi:MAG: hypothetical protein V7752_08710 [Halopseudomonas sp.]